MMRAFHWRKLRRRFADTETPNNGINLIGQCRGLAASFANRLFLRWAEVRCASSSRGVKA